MRILLRSIAFVALFAFVVLLCRTGSAGEKVQSGKELYKQNCRVCHDNGSPHGEYSPSTLIADQWERFFKTRLVQTHKDLSLPGQPGKKVLEVLAPEQLKVIQKFVIDHAADSEQPQTCGH